MCGIVGALSRRPVDTGTVLRMRDLLAHRGPDDEGAWRSRDATVCLAHRRLAVIDPKPEAAQPFVSRDGRFVLVFNGEIYNYRELAVLLAKEGLATRTGSDTEVLLLAYERWGHQCLEKLSGMFALAIWDDSQKKLFCARDRAGEKPFYYAQVNGTFLFASEVKALVAWPDFKRSLNPVALVDYFTLGFIPDPDCIWEGCHKLPPGHWLEIDMSGESPQSGPPVRYWDMRFAPEEGRTDWHEEIRETLAGAAGEMTIAHVPLGTFLSGGVDSSAVTAALSRAGIDVRAFTIGFQEAGFDERPYARQVAERYGLQHEERVVEPGDAAAVQKKMVWHFDEPFNDYSYLPTYYLCRQAREQITVALSGDGGDELYAGYRRYQRLGMRQWLDGRIPRPLRVPAAMGAKLALPWWSARRRMLTQYGAGATDLLADMLNLGFPLPLLRRWSRGPLAAALKSYAPRQRVAKLLAAARPQDVGLINSMRYLDMKLTLAGGILVKVDRASMAVSLEVRPVFLHRQLMDLAGRIPTRLLADREHAKEALKQALVPWLPESILYRRKMGFAMPLGDWLGQDRAGGWLSRARSSRLDEFLDPEFRRRLIDLHLAGRVSLTSHIHSLAFLDAWLEQWQEDGELVSAA